MPDCADLCLRTHVIFCLTPNTPYTRYWGVAGTIHYQFNVTTTATFLGFDAGLTFYEKAFNPQPNMTTNPFISQFCVIDA